jgi:very-short-patch-repair endonuclease
VNLDGGELTHPVNASLDHPLRQAGKRVGESSLIRRVLCCCRVDSPDLRFAGLPFLWQAGKRVGDFFENYFICIAMPAIIKLCRELRRLETPAEKVLWQHLRNRKLLDYKFLRQHPIFIVNAFGKNLYYIPDCYCHEAKLVIEADGPIHLLKKDYDKNRDAVLSRLGLTTVRFDNDEILHDIDSVLNKIKKYL